MSHIIDLTGDEYNENEAQAIIPTTAQVILTGVTVQEFHDNITVDEFIDFMISEESTMVEAEIVEPVNNVIDLTGDSDEEYEFEDNWIPDPVIPYVEDLIEVPDHVVEYRDYTEVDLIMLMADTESIDSNWSD